MSKVKNKEKNLKSSKRKKITCKEIPIKQSADFSSETLQTGREWHNIFKVMKGKTYNQEILHQIILPFRTVGEKMSFSNKQKLKELITTALALQEILKKLLRAEKKRPKLDIRKYIKGKHQRQTCSKTSGSTTYKANINVKKTKAVKSFISTIIS